MSAIVDFLPTVIPKAPKEVTERAKGLLSDRVVLQRWGAKDASGSAFLELKALKLKHSGLGVTADNVLLDMPMVSLSSVRSLAEALGWCIIPIGYLAPSHRPRGYGSNVLSDFTTTDHRCHRSPWAFATCRKRERNAGECVDLDSHHRLHVLAPLSAYSVEHHINAVDAPIFVPSDISQAFAALEMSIPMFRSMKRQIADNRERIDGLREDVDSLGERITRIESDMIAQRLEAKAKAKVKAKVKAQAEERAAYEEWAAGLTDPVSLIFPANASVTDDVDVFVGPSWGDVPDDVIATLKALAQMRKLHE